MFNYKKRSIIIISLFVLCIIITFFKIIFFSSVFIGDDNTMFFYPIKLHCAELLKRGEIPLWTNLIHNGYPLLAGGSGGVFYPLDLIMVILPNITTFNYLILLHFLIAGISMYLFMRILKVDKFASFFSGIFYMFSAYSFYSIRSSHMLNLYVWLPLSLYFVELGIKRKKFIFFIICSLIFGIQLLAAANPQKPLQNLLVLFLYLLFKGYPDFKKNGLKSSLKFLYIFVFISFSSLFLSLVQYLPTLEYARFINLEAIPAGDTIKEWSMSPIKAIMSLLGIYPSEGKSVSRIDTGYICVFSSVFILVALISIKDKICKFFIVGVVISLSLMWGDNNPLNRIILNIPFADKLFMYKPSKFSQMLMFFLSGLAGIGLHNLFLNKTELRRQLIKYYILFVLFAIMLPVIYKYIDYTEYFYPDSFFRILINDYALSFLILLTSSIILILYLQNKISAFRFKVLLVVLLLPLLVYSPPNILPFLPNSNFIEILSRKNIDKEIIVTKNNIFLPEPEFVSFLKGDKSLYRVLNDRPLHHNINMIYAIPGILGRTYSSFALPSLERKIPFSLYLYLNNIKYLISPGYVSIPHFSELVYDKEVKIYKKENWVSSQAILVKDAKILKKDDTILEMCNKDFDPDETIILNEKPKFFGKPNKAQRDKTEVLKYSNQEVIIRTESIKSSFLFLSGTYYPSWKVTIDGIEGKIYRANYLYRAVPLHPGIHTVRFFYDPISFKIGAILSCTTLFFLVALSFYKFKG